MKLLRFLIVHTKFQIDSILLPKVRILTAFDRYVMGKWYITYCILYCMEKLSPHEGCKTLEQCYNCSKQCHCYEKYLPCQQWHMYSYHWSLEDCGEYLPLTFSHDRFKSVIPCCIKTQSKTCYLQMQPYTCICTCMSFMFVIIKSSCIDDICIHWSCELKIWILRNNCAWFVC